MADRYNVKGTGVWATHFPTRNSNDRLIMSDGGDILDTIASDAAKDYLAVVHTAGCAIETAEGQALICDFDQTSTGLLHYGGLGRRFAHGGGSTGIGARVLCNPVGNGTLTLGAAACTYGNTEAFSGKLVAGALAVLTNLYAGGSARVDAAYHATVITLAELQGASQTVLRRIATTLRLQDRATAVLDDQTLAYPTIEMRGGTLRPAGGSVSTAFKALAGILDCSRLRRDWDLSAATVTLGGDLKIINPGGGSNNSSPRIIWPSESAILFRGPKPEGYRP